MNQEEAFKKIDHWLQVPLDYSSIIPALAAISGTREYAGILKKVADADYRSVESIKTDVDNYLKEQAANPKPTIDQMLNQISGREDRHLENEIHAPETDILDDLAHKRDQKIHGLSESEKLDQAFNNYVQKQTSLPAQTTGSQIKAQSPNSIVIVALVFIIILIMLMFIIMLIEI